MARDMTASRASGQIKVQGTGGNRFTIDHFEANCGGAVAVKRRMPGNHGVENHAQGKQVGASIDAFAGELLGSHVGRRAENVAGQSELREIQLGDAEVGNLGVAILGDEYVGGLDIAMDDALRVRIIQGAGDFLRQAQSLGQRELFFAGKNPA